MPRGQPDFYRTISYAAQTVGVQTRRDWAAGQAEDKFLWGTQLSPADYTLYTLKEYSVAKGKSLYITDLGGNVLPTDAQDNLQAGLHIEVYDKATFTTLLSLDGVLGVFASLETPRRIDGPITIVLAGKHFGGATLSSLYGFLLGWEE